jgi:hypothetical protein
VSETQRTLLQAAAQWLGILGFVALCVAWWYNAGYASEHECRRAMAQHQYENGHHGEYCYVMQNGRFDFKLDTGIDPRP